MLYFSQSKHIMLFAWLLQIPAQPLVDILLLLRNIIINATKILHTLPNLHTHIQEKEQNALTQFDSAISGTFKRSHTNVHYYAKRKNKEERRRTEKAFDQTMCLCGRLSV